MVQQDDDDGFWQVAFMAQDEGLAAADFDSDNDENDDKDTASAQQPRGKTTTYRFPGTSVSLQLAELPAEDGILSPVGGDAWYASAVLSSLILQEVDDNLVSDPCDRPRIFPAGTTAGSFRVLELGSGTKALPGFAAAVTLSKLEKRFPSWTVTLTDNEKDCLEQLKRNVQFNRSKIIPSNDTSDKQIHVEHLDWGDKDDNNPKISELWKTDLVIGSELVYTTETAHALVNLFTGLLSSNDKIDIWIVQVTDRSGWQEIVLAAMEAHPEVRIEKIPLTWDIHELACAMIPMGEALDRHAFGAYRFTKE